MKLFGIKKSNALEKIKKFNSINIPCSISYLPIESYTAQEALSTIELYKELIATISRINHTHTHTHTHKIMI